MLACVQALWTSVLLLGHLHGVQARCRVQPGDPRFPQAAEWDAFNATIDGRLLAVVPSAEACVQLGCTEAEWTSSVFRNVIPGQVDAYNWEQDYEADPPELCLRNGTVCAQGNVPLYAVNATATEHVQAGIRFATKHDLRIAVKSSGHDLLGRSTAKNSLLIWVHHLQNITFTNSFIVDGRGLGSAVTVGSGVNLQTIYPAAEEAGKMVVAGTAATVALGGGYIQGGGHSSFSPSLGLAADNALQFEVVLSDGSLVLANDHTHTDLFWALRGGGPGSWGVVISVTVRTYPAFNATEYIVDLLIGSFEQFGVFMSTHARHIFDLEDIGQYYEASPLGSSVVISFTTYFPDNTATEAIARMTPFFDEVLALENVTVQSNTTTTALASQLVTVSDDPAGTLGVLGSRLIPAAAYHSDPDGIGHAHSELIQMGYAVVGSVIAGGKVSENANISSAVLPKWRTAKNHLITATGWDESTAPSQVDQIRKQLTTLAVPVLVNITGESDSGSYSNEADVREPNFRITFFGSNYARLSEIKRKYDSTDLFIVGAGVGSERWDTNGLCTV